MKKPGYPEFDFEASAILRGELVTVRGYTNVLDIDMEDEDVCDIFDIINSDGSEYNLDDLTDDEAASLESQAWDAVRARRALG